MNEAAKQLFLKIAFSRLGVKIKHTVLKGERNKGRKVNEQFVTCAGVTQVILVGRLVTS